MLLDLREVTYVLSGVLDFVGVSDVLHGRRVAFMASQVGGALGLSPTERHRLFQAALLHDVGVSTTREHSELLSHYMWTGYRWHCARGRDLLRRCKPLAHLAPLVEHHHTPWETLVGQVTGLDKGQRLAANIIHLCDRVDALIALRTGEDPVLARGEILERLGRGGRVLYAPDVLAAYREASSRDAFWFSLESDSLPLELAAMACDGCVTPLSFSDLVEIAYIFAAVVDAKSPFTAEHSVGVGEVSTHLAALAGLDVHRQGLVKVAALLHDIGKLRIPDDILDKPGPLDAAERARMNRHAFYTHQILRQISGFEDIAVWASHHHETLDGGGYPYRRSERDLPLEARIISVSDLFQALAQNRPYRPGMPLTRILEIVHRLTAEGKLDRDVVGLLFDNRADLHALAMTPCDAMAVMAS